MSNEKKEFNVGDLIVVCDNSRNEEYYSNGDIGKCIGPEKYDFSGQGNLHVYDKGQWFAKNDRVKHYTQIEDLPLWKSNHMYLNDEQQQALRKLLHRVQWDEEYAEKIGFFYLDRPEVDSAFSWTFTDEGYDFWNVVYEQCTNEEIQQEHIIEEQPIPNGGSSDYYKLTITRVSDGEQFDCEMGDVIYSIFGGDFDLGNIVKACRRSYLATIGQGKQGAPIDYDMNKIAWFSEDFANRKG